MKKKKNIILIAVIVLVLIAAFLILNTTEKKLSELEKENAVSKILGRKANLTEKNVPTGDADFKGKYIFFKYPQAAIIKKQILNGKEVPYTGLELFIFGLENPKITVHVEVIEAPQNVTTINDYPSVRLRQIQSNLYTDSDIFIGNEKGLAFAKQSSSGFEKTAFFFLKGKIYSFSMQSPDSKKLEELFNKIIASFKFL